MWGKHCHKPPMTGNGIHTTYKHGDLGDGLWHCFTHIIWLGLNPYPLVNIQETMEGSTMLLMIMGKSTNFLWPFSIAMFNYPLINISHSLTIHY